MSTKRARTASAYEERNVQSFVDSCTNYTTNVSCHGAAAINPKDAAPVVLLVGAREQLVFASQLPGFANPEVAEAVAAAADGSLYTTSIGTAAEGKRCRLAVGVVGPEASRHNNKLRPDLIRAFVAGAVADGRGAAALDVVVFSNEYLCITSAVAKASYRSFTAKKGCADKSYLADPVPTRIFFPVAPKHPERLAAVAGCIQLCQRLMDAPTNLLDTTTFTEIAGIYARKLGLGIDVIAGEELRERGYGGMYGVGKAAEFPPALVTLTYQPAGGIDPQDKIALVGKGIVYDTGGLSIKTPMALMCGMKCDMGGAAAVFCGIVAAAMLKAPAQMSCTLCLADNAVGPRSQRNDDIVRMKSGVTVEINNTDAEGRLVLGDGVFHATTQLPFTPTLLLDMATLTGAQMIAAGKQHAAIYTPADGTEAKVMAAAKKCGDLCIPVVYAPEFHKDEFASKVADMKNSVANRNNAQVSCAAAFVERHIAGGYAGEWVHVDIAGPANVDSTPTGFGVALVVELAGATF